MSSTQWVFAAGKATLSVPIHSRFAVSTTEAAIEAAVADVGITRGVAYQAAARCREGTLEKGVAGFRVRSIAYQLAVRRAREIADQSARFSRLHWTASESQAA